MHIIRKKAVICVLAGLLFILNHCTPESCIEPTTDAAVKATLYKTATGKVAAPDSLTVYGLNMDTSRVYNKAGRVTIATLPLNPNSGNSILIIKINQLTDTVQFRYSSYPHLISRECGYTFYHNIDTVVYSRNAIDTIEFRKNVITIVNEENIRIYY